MRTRHKTPEDEKRAHEEAQRRIEENERDQEASRRKLFSMFKMWMACPGKACRRGRACRGDTDLCLRERWGPLVPPRMKAVLHKSFTLMNEGMPAHEAVAAAEADFDRREAAAAARETRAAVMPEPAPQPIKMPPRVRNHARGPRIRSLA